MIAGAPSVLYDAIVLLPAQAAIDELVRESTARDFVADAFAHCKFIGYVEAALPLLEKAGVAEADFDDGVVEIAASKHVAEFVIKLGDLRAWDREPKVRMK
jgi:catalase